MQHNALGDVSRETMDALTAFAADLTRWTARINLIAPKTVPDIWERHIIDSAQVWQFAPPNPLSWCDIGSGGGLPGIVVAILARETAPATKFTFIESDTRKATFLRTSIRNFDLNADVIVSRIEDAPPQCADVVSARALASLPRLLGYVSRHLAPDGHALLMKGENVAEEIDAARANWQFEVKAHTSITNDRASILQVGAIKRVS